jgi:hypothetical protein
MIEPRAPFPWLRHALILSGILFATALPYLISALALLIGKSTGCDLDGFAVEPCLIAGADWGGFLRNAYGFGWMILATLPLGGGAFLAWLVITIVHRLAWGRMQKAEGL